MEYLLLQIQQLLQSCQTACTWHALSLLISDEILGNNLICFVVSNLASHSDTKSWREPALVFAAIQFCQSISSQSLRENLLNSDKVRWDSVLFGTLKSLWESNKHFVTFNHFLHNWIKYINLEWRVVGKIYEINIITCRDVSTMFVLKGFRFLE